MMPCSCAASSASAICLAIGSASSSGIGPRAMPLRQILAFDELHHERADAVGLFEAVDVRDVRMIQRRERLRFAREPRERSASLANRSGRTLIATSRFEFRVARAIDLAHAAGPEGREDFVGAEASAEAQGQTVARIIRAVR